MPIYYHPPQPHQALRRLVFAVVAGAQTISPVAIASAEAVGTLQIHQKISPSSITSAEAFGSAKIHQKITPTSIASAEAFGSAKLNKTIVPSGIAPCLISHA